MTGERHAPVALYPRERPSNHCTESWVSPRAGLDRCGKSRLPPGFFFSVLDFFIHKYNKFIHFRRGFVAFDICPGILDARIILYEFVASCECTKLFSYLSITTDTTVRYIHRLTPNTKDLLLFGTNTWYYQTIIANTFHIIQGGSNMTGADLCVNKPQCAAAVRP